MLAGIKSDRIVKYESMRNPLVHSTSKNVTEITLVSPRSTEDMEKEVQEIIRKGRARTNAFIRKEKRKSNMSACGW